MKTSFKLLVKEDFDVDNKLKKYAIRKEFSSQSQGQRPRFYFYYLVPKKTRDKNKILMVGLSNINK